MPSLCRIRLYGIKAAPPAAALSAAVAIAAVTAALVFGSSFNGLLDNPGRYGWTWDVTVGGTGGTDVSDALVPMVAGVDGIGGAAVGTVVQLDVVPSASTARRRADQGLNRARPHRRTLRPRRRRDRARAAHPGTPRRRHRRGRHRYLRPAVAAAPGRGEAVFPDLGDLGQLGTGALTTFDTLARLTPNPPRNLYLIDFDDASHEHALRNLTEGIRPLDTSPPKVPRDLLSYGRVEQLPLLLAGVMSLLGITTLAHTLLVTIRRRRRELAVLKVLGFVRPQVRATVAWQASTLDVAAVVLGVPLGVVVGRRLWGVWSGDLGLVAAPVVPLLAIRAVAVGALAVVNAVAILPAAIAARRHPATALRSE